MIVEEIKKSFPKIKLSSKHKSKKEESIEINPNELLEENGLIGDDIIYQGHSSCIISGTYQQKTPSVFKIIYRDNEIAEENELIILQSLQGKRHILELYDSFIKHQYAIFVFQKIK